MTAKTAEVDFIVPEDQSYLSFGKVKTVYPIDTDDLATKQYVDDNTTIFKRYNSTFLLGEIGHEDAQIPYTITNIGNVNILVIQPITVTIHYTSGNVSRILFYPSSDFTERFGAKATYQVPHTLTVNGVEDKGHFLLPSVSYASNQRLVYIPQTTIQAGQDGTTTITLKVPLISIAYTANI